MRIAIVGTGHVGLITGATLAGLGHDVVGTDASTEKVAMLRRRRGSLLRARPGRAVA